MPHARLDTLFVILQSVQIGLDIHSVEIIINGSTALSLALAALSAS
jgi:hypothetical protein